MKTDIEIAQIAELKSIQEIASKLGLEHDEIELYGNNKAKINRVAKQKKGQVVLVTSVNPTKSGEGKSTIMIGLSDSLNYLNKSSIVCMREPSMGPVFGLKGGACGGGYAQVVPMQDINLHFTGDIHAITSANNLICACIDNHIYQGNSLGFALDKIYFKRVVDMNDRALRDVTVGLGNKFNGIERCEGFDITVASELMAILCLSQNINDLKQRVNKILIANNNNNEPIYLKDLLIGDAVTLLLQEAIKPNLVQTLYNNPVLIHGGPFANIAQGTNSVIATKLGLELGDIVVTEAGFGADLGFEKYLDIKARDKRVSPDCVVIVVTIKAIKTHAYVADEDLANEDLAAIKIGLINLKQHLKIVETSNINYVVALNKFPTDTLKEITFVEEELKKIDVKVALVTSFVDGQKGAIDLANIVLDELKTPKEMKNFYDLEDDIETKLLKVVQKVYGAQGFNLETRAREDLIQIKNLNLEHLPICIAKTPVSLSDDPKKLGAPSGYIMNFSHFKINSGAGFIVCYAGNIMTMPGLNKFPNAQNIKIDEHGVVSGLS